MTDKFTLQYLAQLVIRRLSNGLPSKDTRLDEREIAESIRLKIPSVIRGEWYEGKKTDGHPHNPLYITSYTASVLNDTTEKKNYIEIPYPYENLPDGRGVWMVKPNTVNPSIDRAMIPVTTDELEVYRGTSAYGLEGQFSFYPQGDRIYFSRRWGKSLKDMGVSTVLLKMVVPAPDTIGLTDRLPVSPSQKDQIVSLVVADYAQLLGIIPDEVNDNSSIPG